MQATVTGGTNTRDDHLSLALELATRQATLCETLTNRILPSGIEVLTVRCTTDTVSAIDEVAAYEDVMVPDGKATTQPSNDDGLMKEEVKDEEEEEVATTSGNSIDTLGTESQDAVDETDGTVIQTGVIQ